MLRVRFLPAISCFLLCGCGCQPATITTEPVASETRADTTSESESQPGEDVDSPASDSDVEQAGGTPVEPIDDAPPVKPPAAESDKVEMISFDDLNIGMPVDAKFRKVMLTINDGRVLQLTGKRVNVAGYMNATDTLKGVKEFILLRNLECKFGPGGQADHLVHVVLQGDLETEFTDKVVYVEGVLRINPFPLDGPSTWSIYDIEATKVSTRPPPRGS